MNIEPREMHAVHAAAAMSRFDMYTTIHKALRAWMCDTLLAVGRVDTEDATELSETLARVRALLAMCRSHLKHENNYVHTAMESRAPGSSGQIGQEHVDHVAAIDALARQTDALERAEAVQRPPLALVLYRALALFAAHNFEHMHVEEIAHNAVLWSHYSDLEIMEVHHALVGSIPPAEMMDVMRWMVPHLNPAERAAVLGDMQAHAPAPAFEAVLEVVRPHLGERDWAKLGQALGLPWAAQAA